MTPSSRIARRHVSRLGFASSNEMSLLVTAGVITESTVATGSPAFSARIKSAGLRLASSLPTTIQRLPRLSAN